MTFRFSRLRAARNAPLRWRRVTLWMLLGAESLLTIALLLDLAFPLPLPDARDDGALVLARDGQPLRAFAGRGGVWRYPVEPADVSPLYLQALLNYEDRRFWRHHGVDPLAMSRAGVQWMRNGHAISGGSTLTMQVARLLDRPPRNVFGKALQVLRALQLGAHLDKRQIPPP